MRVANCRGAAVKVKGVPVCVVTSNGAWLIVGAKTTLALVAGVTMILLWSLILSQKDLLFRLSLLDPSVSLTSASFLLLSL